jgi:imidazolonepropionase
MEGLPLNGPISDRDLKVIKNGALIIDKGIIVKIDAIKNLNIKGFKCFAPPVPSVAIPGLIDAHTHLCFAGSRERDYALRVSGTSYQEIAARGGGILDTVEETRNSTEEDLSILMAHRLNFLLYQGITTCEVKSGYGLTVKDELKILRAIKKASAMHIISIVPTCLAAHIVPREYTSVEGYLWDIVKQLLPVIIKEDLAERVDIFIEKGAFSAEEANNYLTRAKEMGFSLCVHGNQFSQGGAEVAARVKASSVDHLEILSREECALLHESRVSAVVLPGASLGLGIPFAPARMMLDEGLSVVIASDWNPGSAPMGQLLAQAAILGASEKLTLAETLAALTFRAAWPLQLTDRGILKEGMRADIAVFPCEDYRKILYYQGAMLPSEVFIMGKECLE